MSFAFIFFLLSCFACGNNIPFGDELRLARPVGVEIESMPDLKFKLRYFVQNQEKTFDGYNLYISRTTISEGEVYASLNPLSVDGGLPTFRHSPEDFDPNQKKEVILEHYSDSVTRFEAGTRYYFRMTAHSREDLESKPSPEVSGLTNQ